MFYFKVWPVYSYMSGSREIVYDLNNGVHEGLKRRIGDTVCQTGLGRGCCKVIRQLVCQTGLGRAISAKLLVYGKSQWERETERELKRAREKRAGLSKIS